MRIIYLTTSMLDDDFQTLFTMSRIKPNPSNQLFHRKLIRALNEISDVHVVSIRPITPSSIKVQLFPEERKENYIYLPFENTEQNRHKSLEEAAIRTIGNIVAEDSKNRPLIIYDGLNLFLHYLSHKIAHLFNLKTVVVVTDNPLKVASINIFLRPVLALSLLHHAGYITISQGLASRFARHRPTIILPPISTGDAIGSSEHEDQTIFLFAGALYRRYGVKSLIQAFRQADLKPDTQLQIAGYGPLSKYIRKMTQKDKRIIFWGSVDHNKINELEKKATAIVNPRPLKRCVDHQSVPSKTVNAFDAGLLLLSSDHPLIAQQLSDGYLSLHHGRVSEIAEALETVERMDEAARQNIRIKGQQGGYDLFGLPAAAQKLQLFLTTYFARDNHE